MPNSNDQSVPVTWSELLRKERDGFTLLPGQLERHVKRLNRPGFTTIASSVLFTAANGVASVRIATGHQAPEPLIEQMNHAFLETETQLREHDSDDLAMAANLILYANALRCCDTAVPASDIDAEWLPRIADKASALPEATVRALAFLAIAMALPPLVPKLAGSRDVPKTFKPGLTFDFNVPGFAMYLAAASPRNSTAADIEPAWTHFLKAFPRLLGSDVMDWTGLLAAARAVYTRFHGVEIGAVAQRLHERVTQLP